MQLAAFAFDYDGTLATDGCVAAATVEALRRLKSAGPRLLLVTGRELPDLQRVFAGYRLFDAIVAENGGLLYQPALRRERVLGAAPPPLLLQALQRRHVEPLSVGRSIIATWKPHEAEVLAAIRECGLEWQIIFNKGAVMCLPAGVNKASGLAAALDTLQLSALNVLAVGDAENDHAMLQACGYRAAVANAIDTLKREADIVTRADHGAGIVELIERFLSDPPQALRAAVRRHDIVIGRDRQGHEVVLAPDTSAVLIDDATGDDRRPSKRIIERCMAHGFQLCVVAPRRLFAGAAGVTVLGDDRNPPGLSPAENLLREPHNQLALDPAAVPLAERSQWLAGVTAMVQSLRRQWGRPHWLFIDATDRDLAEQLPAAPLPPGSVLFCACIDALPPHVLAGAQQRIALGTDAPMATASR